MPDLWSTLAYKPEENGWVARVNLPFLAGCYINWSIDPDGIDGPFGDERTEERRRDVPLVLRTSSQASPNPSQREAFDFVLAHEAKVGKAVLKYLLAETQETWFEQAMPTDDESSAKDKSLARKFRTATGFRELVELSQVSILQEGKDGVAYTVFDFNSALDEEHGFSVLVHRDRPLSFAGSGEDGGGPPAEDESVSVDWNTPLTAAADYLALLKSIKNVQTARDALVNLEISHAGSLRAGRSMSDLQASAATDVWSGPQGTKLIRIFSAVSDQYLRLGKKDDLVAILDQKLADDPGWRRCVELAQRYR